jgi:hypothetical protein
MRFLAFPTGFGTKHLYGGKRMLAYEFKAVVNDGLIEIPDEYKNKIPKNLKVILLSEEITEGERQKSTLLMDSPMHIENFKRYSRAELYE